MPDRRTVFWIALATVLVILAVSAVFISWAPQPTTTEVPRFADTYISSTSPTVAHGLEPLLWLSRISTGQENWTLITFDTAGRWEPGDRILSAVIHMYVGVNGTGTWPTVIEGALVTSQWTEENATWQAAPLITFQGRSTTGLTTAPRLHDEVDFDVTGPFMHWLTNATTPNFSTALAFAGAVGDASAAFVSQQNGTMPGPVLTVTFQTAPPGLYGGGTGYLLAVATPRPQ